MLFVAVAFVVHSRRSNGSSSRTEGRNSSKVCKERERRKERERVRGGVAWAASGLRTFMDFFINARALLRNFASTRRNEVNAK